MDKVQDIDSRGRLRRDLSSATIEFFDLTDEEIGSYYRAGGRGYYVHEADLNNHVIGNSFTWSVFGDENTDTCEGFLTGISGLEDPFYVHRVNVGAKYGHTWIIEAPAFSLDAMRHNFDSGILRGLDSLCGYRAYFESKCTIDDVKAYCNDVYLHYVLAKESFRAYRLHQGIYLSHEDMYPKILHSIWRPYSSIDNYDFCAIGDNRVISFELFRALRDIHNHLSDKYVSDADMSRNICKQLRAYENGDYIDPGILYIPCGNDMIGLKVDNILHIHDHKVQARRPKYDLRGHVRDDGVIFVENVENGFKLSRDPALLQLDICSGDFSEEEIFGDRTKRITDSVDKLLDELGLISGPSTGSGDFGDN